MSGRSRENLAAAGNTSPPSLKMYHTTVEVVENTEKDKINFIVLMVSFAVSIMAKIVVLRGNKVLLTLELQSLKLGTSSLLYLLTHFRVRRVT